MDKQQLIQQIEDALLSNDQGTLYQLLLDQQEDFVNSLLKFIKQDLQPSFTAYLAKWRAEREENDEKNKNSDKIRSINANLHCDSDQEVANPVQREMKKKKPVKLQEKFGYSLYGNIKCLMHAYGDFKCLEQSIKMMHSQIQTLFEQFIKFVISNVKNNPKLSVQGSLNQALILVFKQECTAFYEITKQYKNATKCTEGKQEDALSQQSEDDFPQQTDKSENARHMSANTVEQSQYFAMLTKDMKSEEYQQYSNIRQVGFTQLAAHRKNQTELNRFIQYLDPNHEVLKAQYKDINMVSFICCRLVRKIIFLIIKSRNNGKLWPIKQPVTYQQVLKIGNQLISNYKQIFLQASKVIQTIENKAKKLFLQDYNNPSFRILLPKKYSNTNKTGQKIWQQCPHYRELWIERCQVEQQIQNALNDGEQYSGKSRYGQYIMQNIEHYGDKKEGPAFLWEKYFKQEKIEKLEVQKQDDGGNNGKTRKRVKLESLKSM